MPPSNSVVDRRLQLAPLRMRRGETRTLGLVKETVVFILKVILFLLGGSWPGPSEPDACGFRFGGMEA